MVNKFFSYIGLFFLNILSWLPLSVLYFFAYPIYFIFYHVLKYRRSVVKLNLKNSFPEKTERDLVQIEKDYYKFLSNLVVEIIKMPAISMSELKRRFIFNNAEDVNSYLRRGIPVLFCSAHYGNWEWGNMALSQFIDGTNYGIYKPLSNKIFDRWFLKIRSRFGNKLIPMRQTLRSVSCNKNSVCTFSFAADQAPLKEESIFWMNFLNQPAAIPLGIEKIAKKTNWPVFYMNIRSIKKGFYEVDCILLCEEPKLSSEYEITKLQTRLLEKIIKENPRFWLWSHKRWKHKIPHEQILTQ